MRKSVRLTDVSLTLFALPLMVFMRLLSDRHNKPDITECIRGITASLTIWLDLLVKDSSN